MKASSVLSQGSLLALAHARAAHEINPRQNTLPAECTLTTTLPPVTVTADGSGFTGHYTTIYKEFCPVCPEGVKDRSYTITQHCDNAGGCGTPTGTALPPGFTCAQVICTACGADGGARTATLTFPASEVEKYSASGWIVKPTEGAGQGAPAPPAATQGAGSGAGNTQPASPGSTTTPAAGQPTFVVAGAATQHINKVVAGLLVGVGVAFML